MGRIQAQIRLRQDMNRALLAVLVVLLGASLAAAQEPLAGSLSIHDPSTMIKHGSRYYIFATGNNIASKSSPDKMNWTNGPAVFSSPPSWTTSAVPGFGGTFWAPDIIYLNGLYRLYYSVSTFGSQVSAIGLVTNPTLDPTDPNYLWTDQGAVIQSSSSVNYNAIDPSVMFAADGRLWMTFGSFWTGIKMIELDPATGKRITPTSTVYSLATHPPSTAIEGSCLIQRSNYYYLFVNWDTCCSGVDSTYNIRVGRSASVTGPYFDQNNASLASGGGTMFLESSGRYIGPGHAGILPEGETNWFTYHYYDGNNNGNSKLGMGRLIWDADGWPVLTNDWSAFYTFEADAREHLAQYNGTLQRGAVVTNETGRGKVLSLDGVTNYVALRFPVANASTFAAWVKWNGGNDWQRIFDFGNGTSKYLFLSPRAGVGGKLHFAITTSSTGGEQIIDGPAAFPTGSWSHVAVTLDGSKGWLYLNGNPIATNSSLTIRPWQTLARSNYLGKSQWPLDPAFNGKIDSFRIFGRALSAAEIKDLAYAHPSLAHRYSFTSNAWDSIGMAHGTLMGDAFVTNGALHLTGTSGGYVNLPGGLVSGSSAVTIEFWAAFGVNGNWARVFDFGNISGTNGSQYLFFSPHTGTGTHHTEISSSSTVNLDIPGTLDNRSLFVACIVDPTNGYTAIYTNGVLEKAATNTLPALSSVNASWSFIGRSLFSADAWLNATIDEFRIYDGRLTPEEIATDYSFGPDALALPVSLAQSNSPIALNLSWPSYAVGFVPESSSVLGDAAIWAPLTQSLTLNNDRWQLALPATNAAQFYRLRR
jgi:Glycosyl hydrolases family 43/Concanavalin A-like lectin/glucanases superfamily